MSQNGFGYLALTPRRKSVTDSEIKQEHHWDNDIGSYSEDHAMAAGTLGDSLEPPTMEEVNEMMLRHRKPELDPSQLITPPGAQVRIHTSQEQFSDVNMVTPDKIPKDPPKRRPKKTQLEIANDLYGRVY